MVTPSRFRAQKGNVKRSDEEMAVAQGNDVPLLDLQTQISSSGRNPMSGFFNEDCNVYFEWYIDFIKGQLKSIPNRITSALQGQNHSGDNNGTSIPNEADFFNCLNCIANEVSKEKNLALAQVHETLCSNKLLKEETASEVDTFDNAAQFIFIAFGLLTMLYEPDLNPTPKTFAITCATNESTPSTWITNKINIRNKDTKEPIQSLLRMFAIGEEAIPRSQLVANQGYRSSNGFINPVSVLSANINFYTLSKLANIDIIWTSSACQHLELDMSERKLILFRYPSFCALMCAGQSKTRASGKDIIPPLSQQFFDDYLSQSTTYWDNAREGVPDKTPGRFYKEIIESYRIIFGQDRSSWELFRSSKAKKLLESSSRAERSDPLLQGLCSKRWSQQSVYRHINAGPVRLSYPANDFLYFGDRLLAIQEFVLMEQPYDWKSLWYDRRDMEKYWAFWAALYFGILAVFLAIAQVLLGIAQVVGTFR